MCGTGGSGSRRQQRDTHTSERDHTRCAEGEEHSGGIVNRGESCSCVCLYPLPFTSWFVCAAWKCVRAQQQQGERGSRSRSREA